MDHLRRIVDQKRQRVAEAKQSVSRKALESTARETRSEARAHTFSSALQADRVNIIAEFKRRSPSKGAIRSDARPDVTVREYERGGAAAISVLTEEDSFDGSLGDLRSVRQASELPILRKDFIFDEFQIYESAAAGADALLLIVAVLDDESLIALRTLTEDELQMDALVEVHTHEEMQRALGCGANVIGVNNRNLATFDVTLQTSIDLAAAAVNNPVLISESGIETASDIEILRQAGYRGFLIGESLMRSENPAQLLREFTVSSPREARRS